MLHNSLHCYRLVLNRVVCLSFSLSKEIRWDSEYLHCNITVKYYYYYYYSVNIHYEAFQPFVENKYKLLSIIL